MARTGSNVFGAQHVLGAVTTLAISTAALGLALAGPSMAAPKPASLQALGKPTIAASCKGGSYRVATSSTPLMTISGYKSKTGFALTGTNCDTSFTWQIATGYSKVSATVILDQSDSGPLAIAFKSGHNALKFTANGHNVSVFKAGTSAAHLQVQVRGLHQVTIVLPNGGSDAGILDVTSDALA
jgi:hypothetical protein